MLRSTWPDCISRTKKASRSPKRERISKHRGFTRPSWMALKSRIVASTSGRCSLTHSKRGRWAWLLTRSHGPISRPTYPSMGSGYAPGKYAFLGLLIGHSS